MLSIVLHTGKIYITIPAIKTLPMVHRDRAKVAFGFQTLYSNFWLTYLLETAALMQHCSKFELVTEVTLSWPKFCKSPWLCLLSMRWDLL